MNKIIITVVGKDCVGIIAKVCNFLAERNVNVMDISQTILQGYFNMMMIVDASNCEGTLAELSEGLEKLGDDMGLKIRAQHEDIFNKMHRI